MSQVRKGLQDGYAPEEVASLELVLMVRQSL
jgi:hypothetical protein